MDCHTHLIFHSSKFQREYSIGFTDDNLHVRMIFLHPSDILTLRKVCHRSTLINIESFGCLRQCVRHVKLWNATRKRIVWVAVLHRVCIDDTLFLLSFPIPDMSDLELERAAMVCSRKAAL